jgi:hypothetical protein
LKGPLFPFYGSKWNAAPRYPQPGRRIVEPFAGSACYSCRYPDREVLLVERDPTIAQLWRYLIAATPEEIRGLPEVGPETVFDALPICQEAKWLMGFSMNAGSATAKKSVPARHHNPPTARHGASRWWAQRRDKTASGVAEIKHWRLFEGEWYDAPRVFGATYFIDPPYQNAGKHYRFSDVDYPALANFCETLHFQGEQVIVCENTGADWLPFRHLADMRASPKKDGRIYSAEAVWP